MLAPGASVVCGQVTVPPAPLMTGEPGSFAQRTMLTRIPAIIQQVLADFDHKYPPEIKENLQDLYDEITLDQIMEPLNTAGPDGASWSKAWQRARPPLTPPGLSWSPC